MPISRLILKILPEQTKVALGYRQFNLFIRKKFLMIGIKKLWNSTLNKEPKLIFSCNSKLLPLL